MYVTECHITYSGGSLPSSYKWIGRAGGTGHKKRPVQDGRGSTEVYVDKSFFTIVQLLIQHQVLHPQSCLWVASFEHGWISFGLAMQESTIRDKKHWHKELRDGTYPRDNQFKVGDQVYVRSYGKTTPMWIPGVIDRVTDLVLFTVQLNDGRVTRRHLNQVDPPSFQPGRSIGRVRRSSNIGLSSGSFG